MELVPAFPRIPLQTVQDSHLSSNLDNEEFLRVVLNEGSMIFCSWTRTTTEVLKETYGNIGEWLPRLGNDNQMDVNTPYLKVDNAIPTNDSRKMDLQ